LINVEGLTRYYGEKRAISDVTFRVNKGEILGLLGPNAAGKTTTMRILTCYMPPTSGKATIGGFDIFENSMDVRRITGYLPETPPLYTDMVVRDYLSFVSQIKGVEKARIQSEVDAAVEKTNLGDVQHRIIGKLSKGFKQRVGLAQSLLNNPQIVILDEPTVGLDPKQIVEIRKLIKELGGERTIILSTHILPEVQMICERVIIINEGKIVAIDTPENLNRQLTNKRTILMEIEGEPAKVLHTLKTIDGVVEVKSKPKKKGKVRQYEILTNPDQDIRKNLAWAVVENQFGLYEMKTLEMSLEEIFLKLVTQEEHHA